jgi:hypothetical protein
MKTIEQEIFKALDVNVKETRLIVEFIAIVTSETEQDVVNALMILIDDKRITLVSNGEDAYVYCSLYKDLNEDVLAELAEKEAEHNAKVDEALKNIVW